MNEPMNYFPINKDYIEPIEWELDLSPLKRVEKIEELWNERDNNESVLT